MIFVCYFVKRISDHVLTMLSFLQDGLTYGTLISLSNLCIRAVTRGDRSPSPAPKSLAVGNSPKPSPQQQQPSMDKKRLVLALEQCLYVMLSQSLLFFADPRHGQREKQFLRRELGSEFGSFTESLRRYGHRGAKSPAVMESSASSDSSSTSPVPRSSVSVSGGKAFDEAFLKFVGGIVQNVFK